MWLGTGLLSMVHRAKLHENLSCGLNRRDFKHVSVYHEMDISRFVETINEKWDQYYVETNLKRLRMLSGLSQSELAKRSGVALRQISFFEQRQKRISTIQGRLMC